ncbi:LCP family protein [Nocardiopsis sp. FIRDI 009]|uniref:LCP family protein n=1 Tax=Nocardiopsis sp. FIRDI 009 TaxID=714197 RepID=UPI000E24A428|nr:LCP family protein [Nocardiopsis sp. FIRDI 009]
MAAEEDQREEAPARPGTGRALLWTAASLPLPGVAHLRMGFRRAGLTILGTYLLGVVALVVWGVWLSANDTSTAAILAGMAVQNRWLTAAMITVFVVAVLWLSIIVHSWAITRPEEAPLGRRLLSGVVVTALCLTVALPAALALHGGYTTQRTLSTVFGAPQPDDEPHNAADPWNGAERINVLLIGADSADNRYGARTDSMMVASVDTETGDTVLIGLPRNLENAQFPPGTALAERYPAPYGFDDLLNEVYQTVAEEPETLAINPAVADPSADTLKTVIGYNIGLEVKYYAMVDMMGFRDLIDAVGGIEVLIEEPIPYGVHGGVLEPGLQRLNGHEALWYGRSRVLSDDYGRMGRQGCMIKYVAEQVDPATVLTSYRRLAGATERTLSTDIPQTKVPAFIELADTVTDTGSMSTLQLSPPQVNTAHPDWEAVRGLVASAIGGQAEDDGLPADPSPSASPSIEDPVQGETEPEEDRTEWQEYTGLDEPSPADPGRQVGTDPSDLDALCP